MSLEGVPDRCDFSRSQKCVRPTSGQVYESQRFVRLV